MEKVRTATGKEFDCNDFSVIDVPARAYIRISNAPLATVASVFCDPGETAQLLCGERRLVNYTRLVAIVPEGDVVRVVLGKE